MPNKDNNIENPEIVPEKISKVNPQILEEEMKQSYLDYAMSVIVSRALPDVRDGLKPVHRRILYAMDQIGLRSNTKHRKSALVVGEVLGKYHPHGDAAVYDTMVRMAQSFSMRYRLIDGQGNFGSMDGDSAAAMRYTEARMAKISDELLADIDKNTVDFTDNYDATRQEPTVLPGKLPHLLLNGTLGIAVGMATNIPTHNLSEICDAIKLLIQNSDASIEDLMEYVKGPDFPTGANIYGTDAIKSAYATGKGSISIRASAEIEETKQGKQQIIISEIPYQVNKSECIKKMAELVKLKKIEGISDIRDESDRKEGVRIVIDLKSNAYAKKILNRLFELTPLQTSFHINMVALVDGIQPRLLNLKDILSEYIKHRRIVIYKATEYDLQKAKDREHILQGLKIALDDIDAVINAIRESATRADAKVNLIKKFKLSDLQAEAILEMKLSALAGLERQKILDELSSLEKIIKDLESILADSHKIDGIISQQLDELKQLYGDKRKTKIYAQPLGQFKVEDLIPNEQVVVTLTKQGYIKRISTDNFKSQVRGGVGIVGMETKDEDQVVNVVSTFTHDEILFFTSKGRVFNSRVYELPIGSRQAKGKPVVNVIGLASDETVTTILSLSAKDKEGFYVMVTKKGTIKRTAKELFMNIRSSGIIAIKLTDGDSLKFVKQTNGEDNIIVVTAKGQCIYFDENESRAMGRSAAGVRGIKLRESDFVIAMDIVTKQNKNDLLTILENGYGKRTEIIKHFHTQKRGGYGVRASKTNSKTGQVVKAVVLTNELSDLIMISRQGQVIRIHTKTVKRLGRDTMGVTLMRLKKEDKVASVAVLDEQDNQGVPIEEINIVPNLKKEIKSENSISNK